MCYSWIKMYPEGFQEVIWYRIEIIILFMTKKKEKETLKQIIQFEIVLRDTPLIPS